MRETLGESIYRYVSGRSARAEEYSRSWLTEALARAGSINKVAAAIGMARSTVQGWYKGSTPSEPAQELLRVALRRARLSESREQRIRGSERLVVRGEQDNRDRIIVLDDKYLQPGTMDRVMDAYLRGDSPQQLQAVVWNGIHNAPFYKTLFHPGGLGRQASMPHTPVAPPPPTAAGGGGGPGSGPRTPGGGYYASNVEDYYDEFYDVEYEGVDLDDSYGMGVTGVSA